MEENGKKDNNFLKYMSNPRSFTLKKWLIELLQERYVPHDTIVERVSTSLATDQDVTDFGSLITQIYESGYRKAVEDYRSQMEQLGIKVTVGPQTTTRSPG